MFVALKPLSERKDTADQVIARLRGKLAQGAGRQPVPAAGAGHPHRRPAGQRAVPVHAAGATTSPSCARGSRRSAQALSDLPELADVNTDTQDKGLQTSLVIDRDAASRLGVTPRMIDTTLNDLFGQRQVSTIYAQLNQYHVVMEAAPEYWQSPEALQIDLRQHRRPARRCRCRRSRTYGPTNTPLGVNHQGQFVASTISFNLPPDVSLSQATRAVEDAIAAHRRAGHGARHFQGTARAFQASLESQPWLILAALLTVYIVLGMLYESFVHPITILSTLPSAGVGALLALMLFDTEFSIIAFIGVILLIGIVKKNAIMMIDFALDAERTRGLSHARRDLRGVPAALPADHDDDDGGAARRAAAGARRRRRRGAAPAARHRDRRRPAS